MFKHFLSFSFKSGIITWILWTVKFLKFLLSLVLLLSFGFLEFIFRNFFINYLGWKLLRIAIVLGIIIEFSIISIIILLESPILISILRELSFGTLYLLWIILIFILIFWIILLLAFQIGFSLILLWFLCIQFLL